MQRNAFGFSGVVRSTSPAEFSVDIHLPWVVSVTDVDLDVTDNELVIDAGAPGGAPLRCQLLPRVNFAAGEVCDCDAVRAKWDKATQILLVTVPILLAPQNEEVVPGAILPTQGHFDAGAVVHDTQDTARGRVVQATQPLAKGCLVFTGAPLASAVHDRHLDRVCAVCFGPLAERRCQCEACYTRYCSPECQKKDQPCHAGGLCGVLAWLVGLPEQERLGLRGIKLLLALLALRGGQREQFAARVAHLQFHFEDHAAKARYLNTAQGMLAALQRSPAASWSGLEGLKQKDLAVLISQIHTNLHGIGTVNPNPTAL